MARHNEKTISTRSKRVPVVNQFRANMSAIKSSIQWRGQVMLYQLNEKKEVLLSEVEYPKNSGKKYYGCASTGLIFDKQSGACRQSSHVLLLIDTIEQKKYSSAAFAKWRAANVLSERKNIIIGKPGPKPKGYVAPDELDADNDYE